MAMDETYLNFIGDAAAAEITHIGLVDDLDAEISGGTYARQAVTWTAASAGLIRPDGDLEFDIPSGNTVAGWRAFNALTSGTGYGGEDLTEEAFATDGTYTLLAASTAIDHDAA